MANLKTTTINDSGFLQLPIGSFADRPAVPIDGYIRYNSDIDAPEWYDSIYDRWFLTDYIPVVASGGTNQTDVNINGNTYRVHSFTTTGVDQFTVSRSGIVDILVVGGGGGGGVEGGGGGGAGGIVFVQNKVLSIGTYSVFVGAGGNAITFTGDIEDLPSFPGESSSFADITAFGGGGGGSYDSTTTDPNRNGRPGASGGGGGPTGTNFNFSDGGAGTPLQGYHGGDGARTDDYFGAGGGGAGSPGENSRDIVPGDGGQGLYYGSYFSESYGENGWFAGGGGGGSHPSSNVPGGDGGIGGGGKGGSEQSGDSRGRPGVANTGGGGGGAADDVNNPPAGSGSGGSGIVIIRYRIS